MSEPVPKLRDLVEAALGIDPYSRRAFILDACHGNEELSDAALKLLQEISGAGPETEALTIDPARLRQAFNAHAADQMADAGDFSGTSRFQIIRRLGSGGFGTVYESFDHEQQQTVALKVLRRLEFVDRFKREFRALAEIRHPNLVVLHELFAEPVWFFTMELIHGVNLLKYVSSHQPAGSSTEWVCDLERLRHAAGQLAEGIGALHNAGILHRDIKPGNIIVSEDGRARLLDFGLISETERSELPSAIWAGTPGYIAPELWANLPVTFASDWYAFGVVLFQALVGTLPPASFLHSLGSVSANHSGIYPETTPSDLQELCNRLLHPDPEKRFTAIDVARRLGSTTWHQPTATKVRAEIDATVGRQSQLFLLQRLFDLVSQQGRTAVANVYGSSGVGKTTLLRLFRRRIAHQHPEVVVLAGRCHQNETVPYNALDDMVDGLAHYLRTLSDPEVESLTPHDVQCLSRLFPVMSHVDGLHRVRHKTIDILDAHELRERAFASLHDLLMRLAEKRVVVITVDDLQWGDLDSAAFMSKLLAEGTPPSLLMIASYRAEDLTGSPFLQQWITLSAASSVEVQDIPVEPLNPSEAGQLAAHLLAGEGEVPSELTDAIVVESQGSPFLIDQLARHFAALTAVGSPVTMQQVIENRVAALPVETRRLLEIIAIAGEPILHGAANAAAGLDRHDHLQLSHLASERFVRIRESRGTKEVEPYHHRIGELIVASLSAERQRECHRQLAAAFETEEQSRAALLATHFRSAGDQVSATRYSVLAAEQAAQALAFERAAHWYRLALSLGVMGPREQVDVRGKLADALVHAGHGAQAADEYLEASHHATPENAFELKRLAAEQLLRAGRINQGFDLLQTVAKDLGVWIPPTRWQMMLSLIWRRLRIACSRLELRGRPVRTKSEQSLLTLDVYWSLFLGLATLDPARSFDYQSRHLLLALRMGDPDRLAMALSAEATFRASTRGRNLRVIGRLQDQAKRLATGTKHPQTAGVVATFEGMAALLTGDFRSAQHLADKARTILREQCTGVMWELATNAVVMAGSTVQLGEWSKLEDPVAVLARITDAAKEKDAYAVNASSSGVHVSCLAADRLDIGAEVATRLLASLPRAPENDYLLPHLWLLEGAADIALYQNDAALAWTRLVKDWPALSHSLHFRLEYASITAYYLRGRVATAKATSSPASFTKYVRDALNCARKLERHDVIWARAYASLLRAGAASVTASPAETVKLLAAAEKEARSASMTHCIAACQFRRGMLTSGPEGQELVAQAESWARRERVVQSSRIFDVYLPGRWTVYADL